MPPLPPNGKGGFCKEKFGGMRRTLKDSFRKVRALRARELREVTASLFFLALLY